MSNIKMSVRIVISILAFSILLVNVSNGQVITRRQQFNLLRQQQQQRAQQLDQQQDITMERQEAPLAAQVWVRMCVGFLRVCSKILSIFFQN